jgi:hypothetical protein
MGKGRNSETLSRTCLCFEKAIMIIVQSRAKTELPDELAESVEEYKRTLYWATDRSHILTVDSDELGWGHIVLLVGLRGKIDLTIQLILDNDLLFDEGIVNNYESFVSDWRKYIDDFFPEVETVLKRQYEKSVLERYSTAYRCREILKEPNDLDYFRDERDTIEFFLIGVEVEWPNHKFRDAISKIDKEMKAFILEEALPKIKSEFPADILDLENIDWLPTEFWWRHL